ncbi:CoB--CoM heterodisulfide reductase subunit B, partial [Candidatus Sumerlaeota bacterium]|nr:CoB--CoM heterodisulfide reductase subunit B [Candidatus Sumerlaeota bacterium]
MRAAFFLGCTIPVRAQNFELSTRSVCSALGIELVDLPATGCCGYPVRSIDLRQARLAAATALAEAEAIGEELITICTACTGVLTETAHELAEDADLLAEVNEGLRAIGKECRGTVRVRHLARVLLEEIGEDAIRERVKVDLSGLRFASHCGCHYLKPSEAYEGFDSVENPKSLDRLIELTGAESIAYRGKRDCCGGACLAVDEDLALSITKDKLDSVKARGADGMILICPFCSIMYDSSQRRIETEHEVDYSLPVLYYPQL